MAMGIKALAFSANSPACQGERLSLSLQASTGGVLECRSLENGAYSFNIQGAAPKRLRHQSQISAGNKEIQGNCSYGSRNIVDKSSFRMHFSKCNLSGRNQLQWKPVFYGFIEKTQLVGQTTPRALQFEENAEVVSDPSVEQEKVFEEDNKLASNPSVERAKVGVLLLNLGGPEKLQDVQPFLFNLFADPDIIRLPRLFRFLQRPLARFISAVRAPKSREGYAAIGGGSPLRKITDEQADALRLALATKMVQAKVYVGMRYWHPFTEEAIEEIKRDGINKLVVLPLYPQFSISTSGSSIRLLESIFREDKYLARIQCSIISSWYQREGYIKAMASLIEKELQKFESPEKVMVFFSAHGVPLTYIEEAGDPYKEEMEACVGLIINELKARGINNDHTLAYQSRVGPVEWLKPYTDETIIQLGQKGVKSLLAVPISFVSEHIETLEEIDMEYKELAIESGIKHWGRVPALGCEPAFISDLADAVIEALPYAREMAVSNHKVWQGDEDHAKSTVAMMFSSVLAFALLLGVKLVRTRKSF